MKLNSKLCSILPLAASIKEQQSDLCEWYCETVYKRTSHQEWVWLSPSIFTSFLWAYRWYVSRLDGTKKCLPRRCKTGVTKPWPTRCPLGLAPHLCTWSIVLNWHWVASAHHSCPVILPLASSCDDSDVYREMVGPMMWLHLCSRAQAWFDTSFSGMDCICTRQGPILFALVSCWRARPRITC